MPKLAKKAVEWAEPDPNGDFFMLQFASTTIP